ncbi:hypothetical protein TpMuguga_04g02475 [Theileria parva strain Muguga]|uniref:uncharacterized protein n=1 Tax=Theileria parva strain Muguga TaxID=333668 RepID=UPI001C61C703|nr:uncharacterized protein TpMuguga_04g02475 [Theileria parva strain Muguga]KAF5153310.1 hypothetical protein TpMuguga_04g02475 [Theileria parva strain Muguga]
MIFINFYIIFNLFFPILYKCVSCQDTLESQGTQAQNTQYSQNKVPENSTMNQSKDQKEAENPLPSFNNEVVDVNDTIKGNVLKENPVEKLNELSRDISKEIRENPYYKIPELTRKIREIAVLHPDVMEKLGVYVVPIKEQAEETTEEGLGGEKGELVEDKKDENKEKELRSEIDELMDKTEMMEAMTPEQKLEYIPQLKETIVYQILKNRNMLKELSDKLGYKNVQDAVNHQEYQNSEDFGNYGNNGYYQNYDQYGNNGYYQNYDQYGNNPDYQNYYQYGNNPDYQNYYQYGNNGYYQNNPYYGSYGY